MPNTIANGQKSLNHYNEVIYQILLSMSGIPIGLTRVFPLSHGELLGITPLAYSTFLEISG